jgi:hypothetical protein
MVLTWRTVWIAFHVAGLLIASSNALTFVDQKLVSPCAAGEACTRKLVLYVETVYDSAAWSESFKVSASDELYDTNYRSWGVSKDFTISLKFSDAHVRFFSSVVATNVSNAFEHRYQSVDFLQYHPLWRTCSAADGSMTVHFLGRNTTSYRVLSVEAGALGFSLNAELVSGITSSNAGYSSLSASSSSAASHVIHDVVYDVPPEVVYAFGGKLVLADEAVMTSSRSNIAIPASLYHPNRTRSFGMTDSTFFNGFACGRPRNYYSQTNDVDTFDQLRTYRSRDVSFETGCSLDSSHSDLADSISPTIAVGCTQGFRISFKVSLFDHAIGLRKLHGIPKVTDRGVFKLASADGLLGMFVDVTNVDSTDGNFGIKPVYCCIRGKDAPQDCSSLTLTVSPMRSFSPYDTKRFLYSVPAQVC